MDAKVNPFPLISILEKRRKKHFNNKLQQDYIPVDLFLFKIVVPANIKYYSSTYRENKKQFNLVGILKNSLENLCGK